MAVLSYKYEVSFTRQCLCVSAVPENVTQCVTVKGSATTGFILKSSIQAAFNFPRNKEKSQIVTSVDSAMLLWGVLDIVPFKQ